MEEARKLGIGGEGGLNGDDNVGGEVGYASDCTVLLALLPCQSIFPTVSTLVTAGQANATDGRTCFASTQD